MAKRSTPEPFRYRGGWRGQVTLANGHRPHADFAQKDEAADWIREQLQNKNTEHEPELGGPKTATVAQALLRYAHLYSINKGGCDAELNRINHYLSGAGIPWLRRVKDAHGKHELEHYELSEQPLGWQTHNDARRAKRAKTYALIHDLGRKRCSQVATVDLRELMTAMTNDGLKPSTIQKEIALLKHMFNMARKEWAWKGFENPCEGIKLGKSDERFVFLTEAQETALWKAISECDNPYFWPLVVCAMETTQRKDRLLNMTWENTDLKGRVMYGWSKGDNVVTHLSKHLVSVLSNLPQPHTGRVFPMTSNAVDMAWDGVRIKAGLPTLQFKDTRHLAATALARRGWTEHQLARQLGHKSTRMAAVYVNLAGNQMLELMDRTAPPVPVTQIPPPAAAPAGEIQSKRRADRVVEAIRKKWSEASTTGEPTPPAERAAAVPPQDPPTAANTPVDALKAALDERVEEAPVAQQPATPADEQPPAPVPVQVPLPSPTQSRVITVDFRKRAA
jgi:integrase